MIVKDNDKKAIRPENCTKKKTRYPPIYLYKKNTVRSNSYTKRKTPTILP